MLLNTLRVAALALLLLALACSEHPPATAPSAPDLELTPPPPPPAASARSDAEQLARSMALALGDRAFRAHVKAQLDRSPFREHKLPFQRFLAQDGGRGMAALAKSAGLATVDVTREANRVIPLEMYLPVPEHRRAWKGGDDILVATAIADHDAPVAFDVRGNRRLLDPERPPATPVLAVVPVETDFSVAPNICLLTLACGGGGGGGGITPPPPSPGLYMTKSHFVDDFEGW